MDVAAIQQALRKAAFDGWLFCDFHNRDLMAYKILGLDEKSHTSRRWFYFVPSEGQPIKLSHKVEAGKLDSLPGEQQHYLPYTELHEKLAAILAGSKQVAMQYSPMNNIPYVSVVDGGTIDLVRSLGYEVVSSAGLVQTFQAVLDEAAFESHVEAGNRVQRIKDEAFALMGEELKAGRTLTQ